MLNIAQPNFKLKQKKTPHHGDRAFFKTIKFHSQYLFPCGYLQ